jgi:hypothetical protein
VFFKRELVEDRHSNPDIDKPQEIPRFAMVISFQFGESPAASLFELRTSLNTIFTKSYRAKGLSIYMSTIRRKVLDSAALEGFIR